MGKYKKSKEKYIFQLLFSHFSPTQNIFALERLLEVLIFQDFISLPILFCRSVQRRLQIDFEVP